MTDREGRDEGEEGGVVYGNFLGSDRARSFLRGNFRLHSADLIVKCTQSLQVDSSERLDLIWWHDLAVIINLDAHIVWL
jgi:hypothetical protein